LTGQGRPAQADPSMTMSGTGIPKGRGLRGVFFWLLFLHEQEKSLARGHVNLQRSASVETGEKAH